MAESSRRACLAVWSPLAIAITAASLLLGTASTALANCDNFAPGTGQTATCDTTAPNPATTNIAATAGSSNVTVNIGAGSGLAITRATSPIAAGVVTNSQINNDGAISLTGSGGSGLNRGAAMLGSSNGNMLTNGAQGVISTTGGFNDGMAANGSNNTLINNGTITTNGPSAYGMTAAWGQSNTGQSNNVLINNGTVTTAWTATGATPYRVMWACASLGSQTTPAVAVKWPRENESQSQPVKPAIPARPNSQSGLIRVK